MRPRTSRNAVTPLLLGLALLALPAAGCARLDVATEPSLDATEREAYLESFDYVWTTIRDKHWDPDMGGVDWEGIRDELRPTVTQASSRREARRIMNDMIGRLELTHFGVMADDSWDGEETGSGHRESGLDVRVVDDAALVIRVDEGSDAHDQGVRPGWIIRSVDGNDVATRIDKIEENYGDSTLRDYMMAEAIFARLDGTPGTSVDVVFVDGDGAERHLSITRGEPRGNAVKFGNMPTTYVWTETAALDGGEVGYIAFNFWFDPARVLPAFENLVKESTDRRGLVIDLRGNGGGIGAMSMGMAGWLIDDKGLELGKMYTRDTTLKFFVNPRRGGFGGPVAVLVDGLSASTSEIFAGGLKDLGRARLFGTRTAGAALPSVIERLPTGEIFQYAIADYISTGGEHLEGVGVGPHEIVPGDRQALLAGRDPVLERALAWIREQG